MKIKPLISATFVATAAVSQGAIVITEWSYSATDGEFIEFTNTGTTDVDLNGWSYSDSARTPTGATSVDLSAFGMVGSGNSVILTEAVDADFRAAWNLATSVKVIGGLIVNLGRGDEINIYDATEALVDRLTYADNGTAGGPRTQNVSGITTPSNYGANDATLWTLSVSGSGGAYTSTGGDVGSPGIAAIPEPSAALLGTLGFLLVIRRRR